MTTGVPPPGRRTSWEQRPFLGRIIVRQVVVEAVTALWRPTVHPHRWSSGFPALYTSLDLDVAERLKRTGLRRTRLAVGIARASIQRTVDLTLDASLAAAGASTQDVTGPDYTVPQRIGRELFNVGVAALLVPAAIAEVARHYPRFRLVRDRRIEERATPSTGIHLVIFPDNLEHGDGYPEIARFVCEMLGIVEGRSTT